MNNETKFLPDYLREIVNQLQEQNYELSTIKEGLRILLERMGAVVEAVEEQEPDEQPNLFDDIQDDTEPDESEEEDNDGQIQNENALDQQAPKKRGRKPKK